MNILNVSAVLFLLSLTGLIAIGTYYNREPRDFINLIEIWLEGKVGLKILPSKTSERILQIDEKIDTQNGAFCNPLYLTFQAPYSFKISHAYEQISSLIGHNSIYGDSYKVSEVTEHNPSIWSFDVTRKRVNEHMYHVTIYMSRDRFKNVAIAGKQKTFVTIAVAHKSV